MKKEREKNVPSQAKMCNTPFDQNFTRPPEVGFPQWHTKTNRQTGGHGAAICDF